MLLRGGFPPAWRSIFWRPQQAYPGLESGIVSVGVRALFLYLDLPNMIAVDFSYSKKKHAVKRAYHRINPNLVAARLPKHRAGDLL